MEPHLAIVRSRRHREGVTVRNILTKFHPSKAVAIMAILHDLWWFLDAVGLARLAKLSVNIRLAFGQSVAPLALHLIQERDPKISVYFPGVVPGHSLNEIRFQGDEVGRDDWLRRMRRVRFIQNWRNLILGQDGCFRACLSGDPR